MPATAQKQSRCKPPLAHPSRWPEQQKSPAQEAWIQCMGSLKCLPGSAKVLHAPRQRKGYPQVPLPAPTLGDACFSVKRRSRARSSWELRGVLAAKLAVFPLSHPKCFPATGRTTGPVPPVGRSQDTIADLQHPPRDAQHLSSAFRL